MPTLNQVRNYVDTKLAALWTIVQTKETLYATNHNGVYWQGILWFNIASLPNNPSDGNPIVLEFAPDLTRHPTDQASSWSDAGVDPGLPTMPMTVKIDYYDGPQGKGYVGTVYAKWNGTVYTRSQNSGPETWRDSAWAVA